MRSLITSFSKTVAILFAACFLYTGTMQAQMLWGTTAYGGSNGLGTVFSMVTGSDTITSFNLPGYGGGNSQYNAVVTGPGGKLYGITFGGGAFLQGAIFSCDTNFQNYKIIYSFTKTTGINPTCALLLASNGKFYGTTQTGGKNNVGVIFSFDPATLIYTDVYDFATATGNACFGSLIQLSNGKLYGLAESGGTSSSGVIFSFNPNTLTYTDLFNFNGSTNGGQPYGALVQANNGKLYGTASRNGSSFDGTIFSFDTGTHAFTVVYNFIGAPGATPYSGMIKAPDGILYGGTGRGGPGNLGVLFSFNPTGSVYKDIYNFGVTGGNAQYGSMTWGNNGKFYGTASAGKYGDGVLFSFDTASSTYTDILDYNGTNGNMPECSVYLGASGALYTLETKGGASNNGTMLECDKAGSIVRYINLQYSPIGENPQGTLLKASNGLFYAMNANEGKYGYGTIFTFDPNTGAYANVHDFNDTAGKTPNGTLMQASNGLIYGMTPTGGANLSGTIFTLDPATNIFTDIYDFTSATGYAPTMNALLQATNGLLYGTTNNGGTNSTGVLFSLDPTTKAYTVLYSFPTKNGTPTNTLMQGSDGLLYGMASAYTGFTSGNDGYIFSYNIGTNTLSVLYTFTGLDGETPYGNLIQSAGTGKIYGMASWGGKYEWGSGVNADGTIFSIDSLGTSFADLHYFDDTLGKNPNGQGLMIASNNKLYGMTEFGGTTGTYGNANGYGVIFEYDTIAKAYAVKIYFNGVDGWEPTGNLIETPIIYTSSGNTITNSFETNIYPNPTTGKLTIESIGSGQLMVEVYNMIGQCVLSEHQILSSPFLVDLSNQPAGIYYCKVIVGNKVSVKKVVLMK